MTYKFSSHENNHIEILNQIFRGRISKNKDSVGTGKHKRDNKNKLDVSEQLAEVHDSLSYIDVVTAELNVNI
jgi:hypothetical protein